MISNFKVSAKPKYELILKESMTFNGKHYDKGHVFHPTGYDSIRGYDIEDKQGNRIAEIGMITNKFEIKEL